MQYSFGLLSALALVPAAQCIAFGGPAPTETSPTRALDGWTPKPTKGPSVAELKKRASNFNPETCGWIDGDYSSGVGMAGCCDGSDSQNCGWASSCVDYKAYRSSCGSDCLSNSFIRKCTNSLAPYCVTWAYAKDKVTDYGCDSSAFSIVETIYQTATDDYYTYRTSISLPTLSAAAVTGLGSTASGKGASSAKAGTGTTAAGSHSTSTGSTEQAVKKGVSITLIIGAVVGGLVLLFIVIAVIIFCCVKRKKAKQLAANQQAITAAQNQRPQSSYNANQQPMQQQQAPPPVPHLPPQTPQPGNDGYFKPHPPSDQKYNYQANEYAVPSPISNPSTPAPAYVQPYHASPNAASPPLMPTPSPATYPMTPAAHEVDAISVPHAPQSNGPVYEIGVGR